MLSHPPISGQIEVAALEAMWMFKHQVESLAQACRVLWWEHVGLAGLSNSGIVCTSQCAEEGPA
jgi:hypothetical protein